MGADKPFPVAGIMAHRSALRDGEWLKTPRFEI
jgi:hypothetical protein